MIKKLLKIGVGVNVLFLLAGHYNSKHNLPFEIDKKEIYNNFDLKDFSNRLNEFQSKYPQYLNFKSLSRKENIDKLSKDKFDILVIGGGCSGAGLILEGHNKGYKCALIEANDFASGTSSRSSKLIHGGIRYLQDIFTLGSGNRKEKLKLVYEALKERDFFINSAPFINNVVEIKIPCQNYLYQNYYFLGVMLYHMIYQIQHLTSFINTIPWPRFYMKERLVSFFEGQMFDSRQCLMSILTCTRNSHLSRSEGATSVNYIQFKEYIFDNSSGKVIGIKAVDKLTMKELTIYSDCVVNCTGIQGDDNLDKEDEFKGRLIIASKGSHIVLDKELITKHQMVSGYMIPKTTDGRVLFLLPYQRNYYLIGTTDHEMNKNNETIASNDDINYLYNELKINFNFSKEELSTGLRSKWAGFRPLVHEPRKDNKAKAAKSIARNHVIRVDQKTGLVSLLGGKWTTYRRMGEETIRAIEVNNLVDKSKINLNTKNCNNIKLTGATHMDNVNNPFLTFKEEKKFYYQLECYLVKQFSIPESIAETLVFRYGLNSLKIMEIHNQLKLKDKYILESNNLLLSAELIYSIQHEMTVKPNDFLCRRTGLAFVDFRLAQSLIDNVSDLMQKELNWSTKVVSQEKFEAKYKLKYMM